MKKSPSYITASKVKAYFAPFLILTYLNPKKAHTLYQYLVFTDPFDQLV